MPRKGDRKPYCINGHERTPENTFSLEAGSGCKICSREKMRRRRQTPEGKAERAKWQRAWARKNPTSILATKLKGLYGIDFREYQETLKEQDNKCAICKDEFSQENKGVVDHRHDTEKDYRGTFRAILCRKCNSGIGLLKDDPKICLAAATYLQKHLTNLETNV